MSEIFYKSDFPSAIGRLFYIWSEDGSINFLVNDGKNFESFLESLKRKFPRCAVVEMRSDKIENEVTRYLEKKSHGINIRPVFVNGNSLERKIWEAAMTVPYGKVASYKELAAMAGYPNAWRAAGTAVGHNPVMLIVPCHRIIKSDGSIGRFGGGEKVKEFLLNLEQKN